MIRRALAALGAVLLMMTGAAAAQTAAEWQDVIRHLRHPNPSTRLDAVDRLAGVAYRSAAEPVAMLITDVDDRVQLAAIDAQLRFFQADRIGGRSRSAAQDAFEAGPLLRGSAPVPEIVLSQLLAAVRDDQDRVRFDAIHAFGFLAEAPLSDDMAMRLAAELDHYDPIIRAATARVVGRLRAGGAADAVAAAMWDSNALVRLYAIEAIGRLQDRRFSASLREQLASARGDVADTVLLALGRIGDPVDRDLFRQRINDRRAPVRQAAAEGLGRIDDRDSIPVLEGLAQRDRAAEVRLAAAFALQRMGQQQSHVIAPMLVLRDVNAQARDYLFDIGAPALPGIVATLQVATDGRHRADLVQLVGYLGTATDIVTVEPLAADRDERVRRAVAHAIARLKQ